MAPSAQAAGDSADALPSLHLLAPSWSFNPRAPLVADNGTSNTKDRSLPSDEEDFTNTPYTEYGEFNEEEDEEDETKFLQYGRLFGVSLMLGQDTALGDRGKLWQGGFPLIAGELHYWFDFHLALDLGFSWVQHYFYSNYGGQEYVNIALTRLYLGVRYYFDTKNLSAPISFASPYVLIDFGEFNKTQTDNALSTTTNDSEPGVTAGVGLEFPIVLRKSYFDIQATLSYVTFQDTYASEDPTITTDLTGPLLSITGGVTFTW